jgi:hypothetical protein
MGPPATLRIFLILLALCPAIICRGIRREKGRHSTVFQVQGVSYVDVQIVLTTY